jgi:hypothetical protein
MRSQRSWSGWYVVGVVAAIIAVIECGVMIVLINREGIVEALALPSWIQPAVTVVAILLGALVAIATALGAAPNRHRIEI